MTHVVVQIETIRFYALLLDTKGKILDAEYFPHPEGGEFQRLRMAGKLVEPSNRIQVKQEKGIWLTASIVEVGEYTRSLMVQIDRSQNKAAIALKRALAPVLFVRWPAINERGDAPR